MLIVLHHSATAKDVENIKKTILKMGLKPIAIPGAERTAIAVIGNQGCVDDSLLWDNNAVREKPHLIQEAAAHGPVITRSRCRSGPGTQPRAKAVLLS